MIRRFRRQSTGAQIRLFSVSRLHAVAELAQGVGEHAQAAAVFPFLSLPCLRPVMKQLPAVPFPKDAGRLEADARLRTRGGGDAPQVLQDAVFVQEGLEDREEGCAWTGERAGHVRDDEPREVRDEAHVLGHGETEALAAGSCGWHEHHLERDRKLLVRLCVVQSPSADPPANHTPLTKTHLACRIPQRFQTHCNKMVFWTSRKN
ncbi:hypothetical protein B0H14DRAFT_2825351 [Mycena olivaceomarginata]|nr:hypothetical protein B0H14DRAFT_2825351 [Mycena olivaceomarginata]